jgi:Kef-type K+ transport system membrane component KefB
LRRTDLGRSLLAACFVTDLATVLALGILFAPLSLRTLAFAGITLVALLVLPWLSLRFFANVAGGTREVEVKYLLVILFGLAGLSLWCGNEAVLPAYLVGMVLGGTVARDAALVRPLRALALSLLTPFYFLRVGALLQVPAVLSGGGAILFLGAAQILTKFLGIYPATQIFRCPPREAVYTSLLLSSGLTFGTIAAVFGLSHHIVDEAQFSVLVAALLVTALVPAWIANRFLIPAAGPKEP